MSPSVAYWTSALYPEMEAIAGEVALLRRHFRPSVAWGVSPARWLQLSWRRGFGVHPRLHLAFRAVTSILQRAFQINHLFGSVGDWFHLTAARKRPTLLTVATEADACDFQLLKRIGQFSVEWPAARDRLIALGIDRRRIELVFPPVDLQRFRPAEQIGGSPVVLFASSPDRAEWLDARGVTLLLEAAKRLQHVRFRLLWRPWGDSFRQVKRTVETEGLENVEIIRGRAADMAAEYQRSHLTVAPFTDMTRCKAVPNSIVESMACGRPVVLTRKVGLAEIIEERKCGYVSSTSVESLCESIECTLEKRVELGAAARRTAESLFSAESFVNSYRRLYARMVETV